MMSVKEPDVPTEELDYLTIIPLHEEEETYSIRPCFGKVEAFGGSYTQLAPLYYRINNGEWIEVMFPDSEYDIMYFYINLKKGDELQLKCTTYDLNPGDYYELYNVILHNDARFNVRGTPMSLVYGDDFKENNVAVEYSLYELFYGCNGLTEILNPKTFLPSTVLEQSCYTSMFYDCTNLVNAPELPATTLADSCYSAMFYDCTNLIKAPELLPATVLAGHCYYDMFRECKSLTKAPELPATVLAGTCCYRGMFQGCISLIKAPELPATDLTVSCYDHMFYGCTKLNYIKMLATGILAADCLNNWVNGVSSTGTFVKHPDMTSLPTGIDGIPEGWTVVNDGEEEGSNDFGIEFPLYLTFDYCEDNLWMGKICTRTSDAISVNLYNYLTQNAIKYGEFSESDGGTYILNEQVLDMLGAEIYIENAKVIEFAFGEYLRPALYTEDEFYDNVYLDSDGLLEFLEAE